MPYHTTHRGFGFHHICSQRPTPVLSASTYFNKFAVLVRTYSVNVINSICSRVPSFLPSYSDQVRVHVSLHSLSQFYSCRNPRAPVSVVVFVFVCSCRDSAAHHRITQKKNEVINPANITGPGPIKQKRLETGEENWMGLYNGLNSRCDLSAQIAPLATSF